MAYGVVRNGTEGAVSKENSPESNILAYKENLSLAEII